MNLTWETQARTQGGLTLKLIGRLDSATAGEFDSLVESLLAELGAGSPLVLDVGRVTFISSMGVRSLLKARKAMQARGGAVQLIHIQPQVASVLQMANLYF
ncbi:MAG: STAS domain-containing protein [Kiritimatiellae bacterium]|nr:STAS domain-containing protein [Kiritimatiellia bacterium]MDD4737357.1 STAS domain-containing protein [Kiritimatiellia bacterium]